MTQRITTTCPMDCPDTCALEVQVSGDKITKITGIADGAVTNGYICSKVRHADRRLEHELRLRYPLRRTGVKGSAQFERISWSTAIHEITERFRAIQKEFGGEAILPFHYGGSNGMLGDDFVDTAYFTRLGSSQLARTLCAVPTSEVSRGMYGKMPGVAFEDYVHARFILIWGSNTRGSNMHLWPFVKEARKRGAFVAVIDPRRNFSGNEIDLHLAVKPGSDLPVALAMIQYWQQHNQIDRGFLRDHCIHPEALLAAAGQWTPERAAEVAGISADDIVLLAEKYAQSNPAVLRCGWGLERNRNGGQAVAAVLAMPALLGKFGTRAGGFSMSSSGALRFDKKAWFDPDSRQTRKLNMAQMGRILDPQFAPPVKALFVYNCNPVATVPDQNSVIKGLRREDLFTVVFDQIMTDSARFADIVLPSVTFLEQHEIKKSYGNYLVGRIQPVVPPVGEAKSNHEVFALLGRAMGFEDPVFTMPSEELPTRVWQQIKSENNDLLELSSDDMHGYIRFNGKPPVQFKTVFPRTGDGKINLTPPELGPEPYLYTPVDTGEFPLSLITPAHPKLTTSTFGEDNLPELFVHLSPSDASGRGISDGAPVRAWNDLGEVISRARIDNSLREGVVLMYKGSWKHATRNGSNANALCPDEINIVGGGACYNDARIEIGKLTE